MYWLTSWYNRNRKKIWKTIISGVIIIAIIYFLIYNSTNRSNVTTNVSTSNDITENLNTITLSENKSVVSGTQITTEKTALEVLDTFIEYCNEQNVQEAYDLLSDKCKEQMYPELDDFKVSYYDNVFNGSKRNVSVENWTGDIYKVDFYEDFLATGKYTTDNTLQDYITIVKNSDGEYKLNINKFIEGKEKNIKGTENDIEIAILEVDSYMEYEIYKFQVTNNSGKTISLGDLNDLYAVFLQDKNGLKYNAYLHELAEAEMVVYANQTKTVEIKFYNRYSSSKQIKSVEFSNINLDYEGYYESYGSIKLEL